MEDVQLGLAAKLRESREQILSLHYRLLYLGECLESMRDGEYLRIDPYGLGLILQGMSNELDTIGECIYKLLKIE